MQVRACGAALELWGVCVPDKPARPVRWYCCARVCGVAWLGGLLQCTFATIPGQRIVHLACRPITLQGSVPKPDEGPQSMLTFKLAFLVG